jgi:hypothetical protein
VDTNTNQTKVCTKCGRELPATLDYFYAQKRAGGLYMVPACKECYRQYMRVRAGEKKDDPEYKARLKASRAKRADKQREYNRAYYAVHKEELIAASRRGYLKVKGTEDYKARCRAAMRRYRERHPEAAKAYYEANRERVLARQHERATTEDGRTKERLKRRRYRASGKRRLHEAVSSQVYQALNGKKQRRWMDLVGYTLDELRAHLEEQMQPGMTWDNYGSAWEIDHIRPAASFQFRSPDDSGFKMCWALGNLRPLWKSENRSKGARWDARLGSWHRRA